MIFLAEINPKCMNLIQQEENHKNEDNSFFIVNQGKIYEQIYILYCFHDKRYRG